MLQRQKIILSIINHYDNDVSKIFFVKLAFLVGQESLIKNDSSYYDFVPYKYGPFSFSLYREINALEKNGYVNCTEKSIRTNSTLYREIKDKISELDWKLIDSVDRVLEKYGKMTQGNLTRLLRPTLDLLNINHAPCSILSATRCTPSDSPRFVQIWPALYNTF